LGLAAGIAAIVLLGSRNEPPPGPTVPPPTDEAAAHVNAAAGYAFSYPPAWNLTDDGTTSEVVSPDRTAVVSFGLGAEGDLKEASDRFVGSLRETYPDLEITTTDESQVAGLPALSVIGLATNEADVRVRLEAITIAADRNYAIAVFLAADVTLEEVSTEVEDIVASFTPPGRS
jgi:hypothetical protein